MAAPSYSYTLTNGTTADATEVQQNFSDILNGVTDGTKDLTCSALTVQGNFTVNGTTITFGNATTDSIVFTGYLGASIIPGTDGAYDLGTADLGFRALYLGDGDAETVKLAVQAMSADWTLTLPAAAGVAHQVLKTTNTSGTVAFSSVVGPDLAANYSITATVAASALTIGVKGADGNALSATNTADFAFRSATATSGVPVIRSASSISDLVISSGSTLGHTSAVAGYVYVGLVDNAGTLEIVATSTRSLYDEGTRVSTTAEGGAGAADSLTAIYSTTARTDVPVRWIARLKSTQATAGTYATAIEEISLAPFENRTINYKISSSSGAFTHTTTTFTDVTNLSVSITTQGRPVRLKLVPDGTSNISYVGISRSADQGTAYFKFVRDSTDLGIQAAHATCTGGNTAIASYVPASSLEDTDFVAAGTYTYKLQVKVTAGSNSETAYVQYAKLVAYQISDT